MKAINLATNKKRHKTEYQKKEVKRGKKKENRIDRCVSVSLNPNTDASERRIGHTRRKRLFLVPPTLLTISRLFEEMCNLCDRSHQTDVIPGVKCFVLERK